MTANTVYNTDQRLKSYLDTNQLARERLCLSLLQLEKRFSDVRHRQPRGGPDGGRDLEARYEETRLAFGAVGFLNQASDTKEHKTQAKAKFRKDAGRAIANTPRPDVFAFFTNVSFTAQARNSLQAEARELGFSECEIFDRERMRIALDSPDGFALRYQYLGITLSDAEQATFFARWGDDIQDVISSGFKRINSTIQRVLFLQESTAALSGFAISLELDQTYEAEEIGHFRAFCFLQLYSRVSDVAGVLMGTTDRSTRILRTSSQVGLEDRTGIRHGIAGGTWDYCVAHADEIPESLNATERESRMILRQRRSSSSVGLVSVNSVFINCLRDSSGNHYTKLSLGDLDNSSFVVAVNESLATKVYRVCIYSNGYKLNEWGNSELRVDRTPHSPELPVSFDSSELSDKWVRLRPTNSAFQISFADRTPSRMYYSPPTDDSEDSSKCWKNQYDTPWNSQKRFTGFDELDGL